MSPAGGGGRLFTTTIGRLPISPHQPLLSTLQRYQQSSVTGRRRRGLAEGGGEGEEGHRDFHVSWLRQLREWRFEGNVQIYCGIHFHVHSLL